MYPDNGTLSHKNHSSVDQQLTFWHVCEKTNYTMEDEMTSHSVSCNLGIKFNISPAATFDIFRDGSRWGSVGLLELNFWATIFNSHGDFGQKNRNYHVNTLRTPFWQSYIPPCVLHV